MNITEKLFALKNMSPFSDMRHDELALIAEVARERVFAPGELVSAEGTPVARLYAVVQGRILDADGKPVPDVFGSISLLYNYPLSQALHASPDAGVTCVMIGKGHFFTLINECPEFTAGLIELSRLEAPLYDTTVDTGGMP